MITHWNLINGWCRSYWCNSKHSCKALSDFQKACVKDIKKATELDKLLQPLHTSLFIESNPSPVKYAASLLNMCKPNVRLPLVEVEKKQKKFLKRLK